MTCIPAHLACAYLCDLGEEITSRAQLRHQKVRVAVLKVTLWAHAGNTCTAVEPCARW